jgi:hypothetical protein
MFLSSLTPYVRLRIAPYGEGELLTTASDELSAKRPILGGRLRVRSGHKGSITSQNRQCSSPYEAPGLRGIARSRPAKQSN